MNVNTQIAKVFNFELQACLDGGLSRIYFDDFKSEVAGRSFWGESRNGTDFLVILPEGKSINESHYKPSVLKRMKKADLLKECLMYEDCFHCDDDFTRADLIDLLENKDHEDYYQALYSETRWYDLPCTFVVTGYSQGDAIRVLLVDNEEYTNEYLENTFFGTPQFVKVEVSDTDGNELNSAYLSEALPEYGSYDKEEALRILTAMFDGTEYHTEMGKFLSENLPESLDYQD